MGRLPAEALLEAMRHDKKTGAAGTNFVLLRALGEAFTHPVGDVAEIAGFLRENLP
jgi:3-dehydroquinate synthetase